MKSINHKSKSFGYKSVDEAVKKCLLKSTEYDGKWYVYVSGEKISVSNFKQESGVLVQEYKQGKDITYLKSQLNIKQKEGEMEKPIHAKPSLYALYFEMIKKVGLKYGYNVVLHGSMNTDLDLIAIAWEEVIGDVDLMVDEISDLIGGEVMMQNRSVTNEEGYRFTKTHHGRLHYIINIHSGFEYKFNGTQTNIVDFTDPKYYIDLSIIQTP